MHSHLSLSFSYILYDRRRARKRITRHLAASPMRFVASLVVLLSPCCVCFPAVIWRVSTTQRLPVSPDVAQWLANSDEALPCVIEASESILSVEKLDDELYRGRVAQSKFPLVRIEPSMTFRVAREPNGRISTSFCAKRASTSFRATSSRATSRERASVCCTCWCGSWTC